MISASAGAEMTMTTDKMTARTPKSQMPLPMMEPASSFRPSPIFLPTRTVSPMARLVMTTVMVCMTMEPVETAETSAGVPN